MAARGRTRAALFEQDAFQHGFLRGISRDILDDRMNS